MATALQVPTIFTAIDKVTAPVRQMQKSVKNFSNKSVNHVGRLEKKFKGLVGTLNSSLGALGVGFAGAAVFLDAANTVKEFELANAKLSAVLGKTREQITPLTEQAKKLGATTAFSASEVSGLQTEYAKLGFTLNQIQNAAAPTLDLASATGIELAQAAKQVGSTTRLFGLQASESARVVDVFAASTSKTALDMEFLDVAFRQIGNSAHKANFSLEDSVGILGLFANSGASAEIAGTATRNIMFDLANANSKLSKSLGGPVKNFEELISALKKMKMQGTDLTDLFKVLDKSAVTSFSSLIDGQKDLVKLKQEFLGASGTAKKMADTMLDTLDGSIKILKSSYEGFILSLNDSNSSVGISARYIIDLASSVLTLASKVDISTLVLDDHQKSIFEVAEKIIILLKVVGFVVKIYLTYKAIMIAVNTVNYIHATILGIQAARTGALAVATRAASLSMNGFKLGSAAVNAVMSTQIFVTKLATGAQWGLNAAMDANPIGFVIALIVGLIAIITAAIDKYDEWGAAVLTIVAPVINIIKIFSRNWDMIKKSFEEKGIIEGLKAIGKTLLDVVLYPLQQILEIMSGLPLIGKFIGKGAEGIKDFREGLGIVTEDAEPQIEADNAGRLKPLTSPDILATTSPSDIQKLITATTTQQGTLDINIQDETEINPLAFNFDSDIGINVNDTVGTN